MEDKSNQAVVVFSSLLIIFCATACDTKVDGQSVNAVTDANEPEPTHTKVPSPSQVANFEKLAESSCKCERKSIWEKADPSDCWNKFDAQTKPYFDLAWGTACAPISTEGISSDSHKYSISVKHSIVTGNVGVPLCSDEEADVVDSIWTQVEKADGWEAADAAIVKLMESIRTGNDWPEKRGRGGCG